MCQGSIRAPSSSTSTALSTTASFNPVQVDNDDIHSDLRNFHRSVSTGAVIAAAAVASTAKAVATLAGKPGWILRAGKVLLAITATLLASGALLYLTHTGFRRTIQFWSAVAPLWAEYKFLKLTKPRDSMESWAPDFHKRSAPKLVAVMMKLGGIYVKIGQFLSTVGAVLLEDAYVQALRPLQDGMPPRDPEDIRNIIQTSLGIQLDDVFESFDAKPIGAASIAQAHRGILKPELAKQVGFKEVVVKVQYPEVAEQYDADFNNLFLAVRLWNPDVMSTVEKLRDRHRNELDFGIESDNLITISANMRRRGYEPRLIRIPRVATGFATKHVLVMEFLEGVSLSTAMQEELDDVAAAMGYGGADELRAKIMAGVKSKYMSGGSGNDEAEIDVGGMDQLGTNQDGFSAMVKRGGATVKANSNQQHLMAFGTSVAAPLIRSYASVRRKALRAWDVVSRGENAPRRRNNVDLGRVLKILVRVHGAQVLLDGVYNSDPHPGNAIIMPDGTLGLIDYGMVGRLNDEERRLIASTVVALGDNDAKTVVENYRGSGYVAGEMNGPDHPDEMYLRLARFHMDRVDLSPVEMHGGEKKEIIQVLSNTVERSIPDYIEQMKRIGGLLIGVTAQAGRPASLAREWRPMAEEALNESENETRKKKWQLFTWPLNRKSPPDETKS